MDRFSKYKDCVEHLSGQAFLLRVFWETPNEQAARKLLAGLSKCAATTKKEMKDEEINLEEIEVSLKLGGVGTVTRGDGGREGVELVVQ